MRQGELKKILSQALDNLYKQDILLLKQDVAEWSIAHRLAVYIEQGLPAPPKEWHVDCEYNRQGENGDGKVAHRASRGRDSIVRPDIVVHRRGRPETSDNLLAVELKKGASGQEDADKAREYTAGPTAERKFQYAFGVTIALRRDEQTAELALFEGGEEIDRWTWPDAAR